MIYFLSISDMNPNSQKDCTIISIYRKEVVAIPANIILVVS